MKWCETLYSVCDCNHEHISARATCTDVYQTGKKESKAGTNLEVEEVHRDGRETGEGYKG